VACAPGAMHHRGSIGVYPRHQNMGAEMRLPLLGLPSCTTRLPCG
jgi:hypothetical protein